MRPAAIRRLLVFGVCLVGVGCLYLLPGIAGSPSKVHSMPSLDDLTTASPTTALASATRAFPAPELLQTSAPATAAPPPNVYTATTTQPRAAVIVVEPGRDLNPPAAVGRLTLLTADPERLTVRWPAADDDLGVASYQVWLNGFFVLVTQQTRATLAWFNDSDTHVVQVRALDAAGNEGPSSPTLLVTRPAAADPSRSGPSPTEHTPTEPASTTKHPLTRSPNEIEEDLS